MLKHAHHRGHYHAQSQQHDQPGKTFFHALPQGLFQILLRGKTCQHGVVLAHSIVHQIDDAGGGDDAQQPVVVVQHGNGVLGIVLQIFDTVIDLLLRIYIRIGSHDQLLQGMILPGNDQIFQINGTVKLLSLCHHKQRGNIVILGRLSDEAAHSLLDGEIFPDDDTVGRHTAADLILIKRRDHLNVMPHVIVHQLDQQLASAFVDLLQHIHQEIRLHPGQDRRRFLDVHLLQILCRTRFICVFKNIRQHVQIHDPVQLAPLRHGQIRQHVRQVVFVEIFQTARHGRR